VRRAPRCLPAGTVYAPRNTAAMGRIDASDEACPFGAGSAIAAAMNGRAIFPTIIGALPRRSALSLLSLFVVPSAAQEILLRVVPLQALHLLGSARAATLLYVAPALIAVAGRFSIPFLVGSIGGRLSSRWVVAAVMLLGIFWSMLPLVTEAKSLF
jgi:hypothetical protein